MTVEHNDSCHQQNEWCWVFVPGCPLCQVQKAAPQLQAKLKALAGISRQITAMGLAGGALGIAGDEWTALQDAIIEAQAALAAAEVKE